MICANPDCGKTIPPKPEGMSGRVRKYCGRVCQADAGNKRRAARNAAAVKARPPGICRYRKCGKPFEQTRSDREFCNDVCAASEQGLRYYDTHGYHRKPGEQKLATNAARWRAGVAERRAVDHAPVTCANPACDSGPFCPTFNRGDLDRFCSERCAANVASTDWAARNPDAMRHAASRRRALARGNGAWPISKRDFPIYREQQWWLAHGVEMDVDHWIPIARGGQHTPGNLVLLLAFDNGSKGAKDPWIEWQPPAYYTALPAP